MVDESLPRRDRAALPEKIGRYRIVRCIGRGAMGVVYEAHDEVMGRQVGLKVLMADFEGFPDALARFQREAQAAARLVHPNIITIFDAGEDQGRSFIAMQLLEGWPLAEYLKRPEAEPLERKLDLMVQMCEGLTAAHGQGVIHRDLKPNNLFVQSDGLLKIYDFGVARLAESTMTVAGTMIGTPDYMSPEQARGAQIDARSDIFSAGAVFYFILAGRKPFPGPDLPTVLHQLQFSEPAPLAGAQAPADLAALVMRAMAKSPAERPPRIEELLAGLVRFRRQYQAETRRLAASVRARYDLIVKLDEAVAAEAAAAGLPNDRDDPAPAVRFPLVSAAGAAGLDGLSVDRARITAMLHELDAERQRLTAVLDGRRAHIAQIESGRQLLLSGDAIGALKQFELVAAAYPAAALPRALADGCRSQARDLEARDRRLAELTGAARRQIDLGEWVAAIASAEDALSIAPQHGPAAALLAEARQAIDREKRRQELALERVLDRVERAIEHGDFDAAAAALREAEALKADAPAIAALRRQLTEVEAAAEAAELLQQMSLDEVRLARGAFRRGRHDEAIQQLRAFLDAEPEARLVAAELNRLVQLRERLVGSSTARNRKAAALLADARPLAERQQLPEALELIREALRASPGDLGAALLFDELMERDLAQQLAAARTRAAEHRQATASALIAAGREAVARGYLAVGLDAALAARRVAPASAEAASLADEIHKAMDAEDIEAAALADAPFADLPADPRPPDAPAPRSDHGVLSHVNQWATDLLRRRAAKT